MNENVQNNRKRSKSPTITMGPLKTTSTLNVGLVALEKEPVN
jgi:hypothetical protein